MGLFSGGYAGFGPCLRKLPGGGAPTTPALYPLTNVIWVYFKSGATVSTPLIHTYGSSSYCNTMSVVSGTVQTCGGTYDYYPGTSGLKISLTSAVTTGSWCMIGVSFTTSLTQLYCYNSAQGKEYYTTGTGMATVGPVLNQYWFNGDGGYAATGAALYSQASVYNDGFNGKADFTMLANGLNPIDFAKQTNKHLFMYAPLVYNLQQFGSSYPMYLIDHANAMSNTTLYKWGADAPVRNPIRKFLVKPPPLYTNSQMMPFFH